MRKIECGIKYARRNSNLDKGYGPHKCSSTHVTTKNDEKKITLITTPLGKHLGFEEAQEMVVLTKPPNINEMFHKYVYICEPYGKKQHKSNDTQQTFWFEAKHQPLSELKFTYLKYERKCSSAPPTYTFYSERNISKDGYKPPERLHVLPMLPSKFPFTKHSKRKKFTLSSFRNWTVIHGMKKMLCWKCYDNDGSSSSDEDGKSASDASGEYFTKEYQKLKTILTSFHRIFSVYLKYQIT